MEIQGHKFSECAAEICPDVLQGKTPGVWLKGKYTKGCIFGLEDLKRTGFYRIDGWEFYFGAYLKQFIIRQWGSYEKQYAPNKTALRNSTFGRIDEIIAVNK